jgi:hypothetical protein
VEADQLWLVSSSGERRRRRGTVADEGSLPEGWTIECSVPNDDGYGGTVAAEEDGGGSTVVIAETLRKW